MSLQLTQNLSSPASSPAKSLLTKLPQIMQQHHQNTSTPNPQSGSINNAASTTMVVSSKTPFSIEHILCQNLNNQNNQNNNHHNNNNSQNTTNQNLNSAITKVKHSSSKSNLFKLTATSDSDKLKVTTPSSLPPSDYSNNNHSSSKTSIGSNISRQDQEEYQRIINRER